MLPPFRVLVVATGLCLALPLDRFSQATIATGNIQGIVSDQSGARVAAAEVSVSNRVTGQNFTVETHSAGTCSSGALIPGTYLLRVEALGFRTVEFLVKVQVGVTRDGRVRPCGVGLRDEVI